MSDSDSSCELIPFAARGGSDAAPAAAKGPLSDVSAADSASSLLSALLDLQERVLSRPLSAEVLEELKALAAQVKIFSPERWTGSVEKACHHYESS